MPSSSIQTISNLNHAIANPTRGDWLFIDLDNTLLLPGLNKYKDTPALTESELAATIKMLHERGIQVIGLTARKTTHATATRQQLKSVGIELDEIIHAPSQEPDDDKKALKGKLLKEFAKAHQPEIQAGKLKRIFVFDDSLNQLQDIAAISQEIGVPVFLKQYTLPKYLAIACDSHSASFPENLDDFTQAQELGGGTKSVFSILNPKTQQKLVLKFGTHEEANQLEILTNALYHELGVLVPPMRIYNHIPKVLAQSMKSRSQYGLFKVCEYIDEAKDLSSQERALSVKDAAGKKFAAHVLLGNIDIAKEDNFIVDEKHQVYCIDAGANFMFRSRGGLRQEDAALASEIDSLVDPAINQTGCEWFGQISATEQEEQLREIHQKLPQVEKVAWDVSQALKIPDDLRNRFLQNLSDRVDILTIRLQQEAQPQAKIDKRARAGTTAAGVLTYMIKDNKPCILLSKRVRHAWWGNFGGNSNVGDDTLAATAAREVAEESNQTINYTIQELLNSPFHDIVTRKGANPFIYRMYICEYDEIDLSQLQDHEHTAHLWVPLDAILKAVKESDLIEVESQKTVCVQIGDERIPLYPPLYCMLKQMTVFKNMQQLNEGRPLKRLKTLGFADQHSKIAGQHSYRPLITPQQKHSEVALNTLKKSAVLAELKNKNKAKSAPEKKMNPTAMSQSELHLKALLGDQYNEKSLEANVRCFVEKHYRVPENKRDTFIKHSVELIENERAGHHEQFYFYHACNNEIAFIYDVYTRLYSELQAHDNWPAFRPDSSHLKRFNHITELMAFYSENGTHEIDNNDRHYNDCAISANVFLFGNHETDSSSSIDYMLNNLTRRRILLSTLLSNIFKPFHATDQEIDRLIALFDQYMTKQGGVLYQIGMSHEDARRTSYASGFLGVKSCFQNSHDLTRILEKFKTDPHLLVTNQEYIAHLQARVMVPPQLNLQVQAVSLDPLPEPLQKNYQAALKRVIRALTHQILSHYSPLHADLAEGALTKTLPFVLRGNQLTYPDRLPEKDLLNAIKANDAHLVKEFLKKQPGLLHKKIHPQRDYISHYSSGSRPESFTVLQHIIGYSTIPLDGILDFSLTDWLDALPFFMSHSGLINMVRRLPEAQRLKLISKHLSIVDPSQIIEVIRLLPQSDRLPIAAAYKEAIKKEQKVSHVAELLYPDERMPFLRDNLSSVHDLIWLLPHVPQAERLTLVMKYKMLITRMSDLIAIFRNLSHDNVRYSAFYYSCVSELLGKTEDHDDFAGFIQILPEVYRIKLAEQHEDKIRDAEGLAAILWQLPENERLKYALRRQTVIRGYCRFLGDIVSSLPPDDRYVFAKKHADHLSTESLRQLLFALKPEHRLDYVLENKELILWHKHFIATFEAVPLKDRIRLLDALHSKLNVNDFDALPSLIPHPDLCLFMANHVDNWKELIFTLTLLPRDQRLDIAIKYQRMINDGETLAEIISLLPEENGQSFALQHRQLIKTGHSLERIAKSIDENQRPFFMLSCIQSQSTLKAVLKIIPIEERLALAKHHQTIFKTESVLGVLDDLSREDAFSFAIETINTTQKTLGILFDILEVIEYFPANQRLKFVKALNVDFSIHFSSVLNKFLNLADRLEVADTILKNEAQLLEALRSFPKGNTRLEFATKHQSLIKSIEFLSLIINSLPEASRFEFATAMQPIIKPGDDFSSLLYPLNPDERLAFARANRDKIIDRDNLSFIGIQLPGEAHIDFLKSCVKNVDTLICTLKNLSQQDVFAFAMMHQDLITDTYSLHRVLRCIDDPTTCLEFVLANEKRCQDNKNIDEVAHCLPSAERMPYLLRNLKDGLGVAAIMNLLPDTQKVEFACQHEKLIQSGEQFCAVIHKIPSTAKSSFLIAHMDKLDDCHSLIQLLMTIKLGNPLSFVVAHKHLIKDKKNLITVVNHLIKIDTTMNIEAIFNFITENLIKFCGESQQLSPQETMHFIITLRDGRWDPEDSLILSGRVGRLGRSAFGLFSNSKPDYFVEQARDRFYNQLMQYANDKQRQAPLILRP